MAGKQAKTLSTDHIDDLLFFAGTDLIGWIDSQLRRLHLAKLKSQNSKTATSYD